MPASEPGRYIRVAILSDIHPTDDSDQTDTTALKMGAERTPEHHPFEGLYELIKRSEIEVELILCAGDLGSQSDPKTIEFSWNELQTLKFNLNSQLLIATPGNHDHDSRSTFNKYDPKGYLQSLSPPFPHDFGDDNSHFWAWNFDIVEQENYRIVILNSSAYHGINNEYLHGRVTEFTIKKIKEKLEGKPDKHINILLCHHHIHKNEDINITDYDAMHGADKLLQMLSEISVGEWLVIHGHKHYPKIYYGNSTSGDAPIIFSAGSFSGDVSGSLGSVAQNQFYILEFNIDALMKFGLVGTFNAWDWAYGRGWVQSSERSGLPHTGGFGYQSKTKELMRKINRLDNDTYSQNEIYSELPELEYLTPSSLLKLKNESSSKGNFEIFIRSGKIINISRMKEE